MSFAKVVSVFKQRATISPTSIVDHLDIANMPTTLIHILLMCNLTILARDTEKWIYTVFHHDFSGSLERHILWKSSFFLCFKTFHDYDLKKLAYSIWLIYFNLYLLGDFKTMLYNLDTLKYKRQTFFNSFYFWLQALFISGIFKYWIVSDM